LGKDGGLLPRPPPDGLPVLLGALGGVGFFLILYKYLFPALTALQVLPFLV
jgi:hypothetical protein